MKEGLQTTEDTGNTEGSGTDEGRDSLRARLFRALGPLAGGMILDLIDLSTLGPLGIYLGLPIGAAVAWWLSGVSDLGPWQRVVIALLAGVYCMLPFTGLLPVATALTAVARFLETSQDRGRAEIEDRGED